jgi:uncharacterized protein DUF4926
MTERKLSDPAWNHVHENLLISDYFGGGFNEIGFHNWFFLLHCTNVAPALARTGGWLSSFVLLASKTSDYRPENQLRNPAWGNAVASSLAIALHEGGFLLLNSYFILSSPSAIFRAFMRSPEELARDKMDIGLSAQSMKGKAIKEHDRVVLKSDLPAEGLKAGDVGTVVHIYRDGLAYEASLDSRRLRWCAGEQKAAVSDSGYSQIAGDTPATTGVQPTRSEVLAGDGVQLLNCLMRQLKASGSHILSQVFHW